MDPGGPGATAGRTFWTFWNYITDIVGRIFRPEPPGTEINDTNTTNSVNDELLDSCHKKDNFSSSTEEGEVLLVPSSSVSSTRPVVLWDSGSELQSEMRQNVVEEDSKVNEKDDGITEDEIETGIDVAANLPITLTTTMDNHDQSSDVTMNAEELMPKILVNSPEEIMTIDIQVSDRDSDTPQNKDQLNEEEENNTDLPLEAEITHKLDIRTEGCDGKLQSDDLALEERAPIEEKVEHAEADDTEESTNNKCENDDKNAMKGAEEIEIKNKTDKDQYNETETHLTTNLEMTRQDADESNEELDGMFKEVMDKVHTLVLVTDDESGEDGNSESYEDKKDDSVVSQNITDVEESQNFLERQSYVESSMYGNNCAIVVEEEETLVKHNLTVAFTSDESADVKSENVEKEIEFKEDQSEILKKDVDMTNQNETLHTENGDNSKETCVALIIDHDMTQQNIYMLEKADGVSSTEELKDTNKDDLNKIDTSLETELFSILNNDHFQNEYCEVQGSDESIIPQEVESGIIKLEEHTATDRNEQSVNCDMENKTPGKLEYIFGEENDNNDFITQDLTHNMEDGEQLDAAGLEKHRARIDLDLEGIFDAADPVEVSNEIDCSMGNLCVTIKNQGGSTEEQAKTFKNILLGECEGKELPYSYKESRKEVPVYNNEPDNGSSTQRFLEVGNSRENQPTLLQEEAECGAAKCLQNSSTNEGEESLEDLMETELIKNSLEEHIARPEQKTSLPDMKTTSEYMKIESYFVSEDVEEKGEDLKEEARELEFEMRESLCDVHTVVDGVEIQDSQTEFHHLFLEQSTFNNVSNIQMVETPCGDNQTTGMDHVLDTKDGLFTFEDEVRKVQTISEKVNLQSTDEDSTTVSNDDVLPDVAHHEISANEDVQQRCTSEQLTYGDVIEDEILDLWIQQTSTDNSEVREEDQGLENIQCDLPEEKVESIPELSIACDVNESTTESGFFEQSLDKGPSLECNKEELPEEEQIMNASGTLNKSDELNECSLAEAELETSWSEDLLKSLGTTSERTDDGEAIMFQNIDVPVSMSSLVMQNNSTFSIQTDDEPFTTLGTLPEPEVLTKDQSESFIEIKNTLDGTVTPNEGGQLQEPLQEKTNVEALQEFEGEEDIDMMDGCKLDFTPQKSRIAVKNPSVRPPKDFRSLLHKPSLEPSPSKPLESHVPAGVPMGASGIRIKLPGLGSGFPVLKKTKKTVEEETETTTQETKPVEEDQLKQDSQQKPKWMPPGHPGFGNPLMSELKSKLKKTPKE